MFGVLSDIGWPVVSPSPVCLYLIYSLCSVHVLLVVVLANYHVMVVKVGLSCFVFALVSGTKF
jgi:hypothetical protein